MNGHDVPEIFDRDDDELARDGDFQRWNAANDRAFMDDFLTGAMVRNVTNALNMLDEAMRKP